MATASTSSCREDARYALRAATQSDVSIYTLDPAGLNTSLRSRAEHANPNSTYGDGGYIEARNGAAARAAFGAGRAEARGPGDAARYLAEESGGFAVVNTNNLSDGFSRLVHENSSYYLVGYYPANARADERARRNEVKVSRPGVRAVYRTSYLAPPPQRARQSSAHNASALAGTNVDSQLQELANNPLAVSTMPLRVAAAPFAADRGRASVSVVVEIPRVHVSLGSDATAPSTIKLSVGLYDRDGKAVSREEPIVDASGAAGDVVRVVSRLPVRAGQYRLWVGGVQVPTGLGGSVITDIEVPDFNRSRFALSGIWVLRGKQPVAHRVFASADDVSLAGEIYDRRADGGSVIARLHIASRGGRSVYEANVATSGSPLMYRAVLPLYQLGPGTYLATVEASSARPSRVSARRTIGFTVK